MSVCHEYVCVVCHMCVCVMSVCHEYVRVMCHMSVCVCVCVMSECVS